MVIVAVISVSHSREAEKKVLIKTVCVQISVSEDFPPQIIKPFKLNIGCM